jgi:hypothetical protein
MGPELAKSRALDQCRRVWRRLGVSKSDAAEMAAELDADLSAAASEGLEPSAIIGLEVRAFATAWAEERGVVHTRLWLVTTAVAAVIGSIPGASFSLFIAYGMSSEPMAEIFGGGRMIRVGQDMYEHAPLSVPTWLLLALYALGAVFAYAGAVGAVGLALQLRLDPVVRGTVKSLAVGLPFATGAAIGAAVAYSSTTDFSTSLSVVIGDVLVAVFVFAAGVALIRFRTVRREPFLLPTQT